MHAELPLCDDNPAFGMQAMVKNIVNFAGVVFPVQAAMVASKTAAQSDSLTFYGRTGEFWGFRVEHSDDSQDNVVTYEVPAKTLVQLRVLLSSHVAAWWHD